MKTSLTRTIIIVTVLYLTKRCHTKVIKNNALMQKMMTHFQKDPIPVAEERSPSPVEYGQKPTKVMQLMQNILCKNFPSIPCNMIMQDGMLRALIEQSIDQMKVKKQKMGKTTNSPFIVLPSEEVKFTKLNKGLDNEIRVKKIARTWTKKKQKRNNSPQQSSAHLRSHQMIERESKEIKIKNSKHRVYNGRKKIRRFYPHKIKYKDKTNKMKKLEPNYSGEKLSMSVEIPDMTVTSQHHHINYKVEPADPPVWRIDYTKHGDPSLNLFDDPLKAKIMKPGPNVLMDEQVIEQVSRKEVLPPNVYIKKKSGRKKTVRMSPDRGAEIN